jgi:zinc protease
MEPGHMNITEHEVGPMRLFAARTGARDIVTVEGSVLGGYHMLPKALGMTPRLGTALLDAGTKSRGKDVIRSALAARGASISFSPGGDRTFFSATCLPEDLDFVIKLIAECLSEATFAQAELVLQKKRTLAELEEAKTDTRFLASNEFFRLVYDREHANFSQSLAETVQQTSATSRANVLSYRDLLGKGGLVLSVAGDISPNTALTAAERAFKRMSVGTAAPSAKKMNSRPAVATESRIVVADKANIDVFMGAHVPLTYDDPQYLAFTILTDMLGGRGLSSGHLMRTIRERDGLTYGIYAVPVGFVGLADGAFRIWATFSPTTYEQAIAATKKEIDIFLRTGITQEALDFKKRQITGKHAVGLATSGGIAGALHSIGVEGKPLSYIEEYPSLVNALTVSDIKDAAALVPWDKLSIAAAGTFEK